MILTWLLNEFSVYSHHSVYCLPFQGRKARASIGVYEFDNMVISHHAYKRVSTSLTNKSVSASMWEGQML